MAYFFVESTFLILNVKFSVAENVRIKKFCFQITIFEVFPFIYKVGNTSSVKSIFPNKQTMIH